MSPDELAFRAVQGPAGAWC